MNSAATLVIVFELSDVVPACGSRTGEAGQRYRSHPSPMSRGATLSSITT